MKCTAVYSKILLLQILCVCFKTKFNTVPSGHFCCFLSPVMCLVCGSAQAWFVMLLPGWVDVYFDFSANLHSAMVSCSRFIRITNSSDHRRAGTANLLYTKSLLYEIQSMTPLQFETWLEVEVSQQIFAFPFQNYNLGQNICRIFTF